MPQKNPSASSYNSFNNRAHKLLSPEDVKIDTLYAFSLNPAFTPMNNTLLDLPTYNNDLVDDIFSKLQYSKIRLVHELSSSSKWHLHGYIKITDIMNFYIFDAPILKSKSSFEIDTITDIDKWKMYVYKQKDIMQPFCKDKKIPYQINTIDDVLIKCKVDAISKMKKSPAIDCTDWAEYDVICDNYVTGSLKYITPTNNE